MDNRLWRPAAQRSVRNAWGYIQGQQAAWCTASANARSAATNLVNAYLSQRYLFLPFSSSSCCLCFGHHALSMRCPNWGSMDFEMKSFIPSLPCPFILERVCTFGISPQLRIVGNVETSVLYTHQCL